MMLCYDRKVAPAVFARRYPVHHTVPSLGKRGRYCDWWIGDPITFFSVESQQTTWESMRTNDTRRWTRAFRRQPYSKCYSSFLFRQHPVVMMNTRERILKVWCLPWKMHMPYAHVTGHRLTDDRLHAGV